MFIRFSHPQYLWLLPILWAFTLWVLRGSLADLGRARGRLAAGMRLLLIALLVLALSGVQLVRPTTNLCTVFVVDVSDSVLKTPQARQEIFDYINAAVKKKRPTDTFALVAFGAEALLDRAPEDPGKEIDAIISTPSAARTDIAAGIQLAMASFPQDSGKQIVLFSDGNENLGDALEQAALAASGDVRISVKPLKRETAQGEVLLRAMTVPPTTKRGTPFQVSVVADALTETDGTILLYRDETLLATKTVHLKRGTTLVPFEQTAPSGGIYQYKAVLQAPRGRDTLPDNNSVYAFTRVQGTPKVLVVENVKGDAAHLATALRGHQVETVVGGPDRIPATLAECTQYDSVVFANVPAWRMTPTQMTVIRQAVRDTGMGFVMIGGDESFGAGGYYKTPIEEALPVTMEVKKQKTLPSMTLVVVIDVSGSMSAMEGGVMKVKLAAQAAIAAVDVLQPIDNVCVIGYDTAAIKVVEMTQVGQNKSGISGQISRLEPGGGGILIHPALEEAHRLIRNSDSAVKHVIVCSDACDTEAYTEAEKQGSYAMARKMRKDKISLSIIGFGTPHDPDIPLQQKIVKENGGNWYLAERLSNLPQIFSRDVMFASKSLLVEELFQPKVGHTGHDVMKGIGWGAMPPLKGYVAATFRDGAPTASLLLQSRKDDPVLATWTYGLGRTVAFTSDAGAHWGLHWLGWEGYSAFWTQATRWSLRQASTSDFQTTVNENHGRATVVVEAVSKDGEFRNLLDLRAHVSYVATGFGDVHSTEETIPLEQTAPGRYETAFETKRVGTYVVTIEERKKDGKTKGLQTCTLVIPYSPEFQRVTPNVALLEQVAARAKGEVKPPAADLFGRLRFGSRTLRDIWPLVLCFAALCFLLDIAVRRILLPFNELLTLAREAIRTRFPVREPATTTGAPAPRSATVGSLLGAKQRKRVELPSVTAPQPPRDQGGAAPTPMAPPTTPPTPTAPPPPLAAPEPSSTAGRLLQKKRERGK